MNFVIFFGLMAAVVKLVADVLTEIRGINEDGTASQDFNWRDLRHLVPTLKVAAASLAFLAAIAVWFS